MHHTTLANSDVTDIAKAAGDLSKESIVLATILLIVFAIIALVMVASYLWGKHGKPAMDTALAMSVHKTTQMQSLERMQLSEATHLTRIERVADRLEEHECGSGTFRNAEEKH